MRRILVGHHNGRAGESASCGVWMVAFQGLPCHASVQVRSHFERISIKNNTKSQIQIMVTGIFSNKKKEMIRLMYTYAAREVVSLE